VPRVRPGTGARCVAHGDRCRLGGGSAYASPLCRIEPPSPCDRHGDECKLGGGPYPVTPGCFPRTVGTDQGAALEATVREARVGARVRATGLSPDQAADQLDAERAAVAAEREVDLRRWERLSCGQVDAELTARWERLSDRTKTEFPTGLANREAAEVAELCELLLAAQAAHEALRPPPPAQEPAESLAPLAVNPALSVPARTAEQRQRPQRSPEPPSAGPVASPPAGGDSRPRRRRPRRRGVFVTSINPYLGHEGDGYNDPFRGD
jgi:hypothetical protein